jgi:thiol-disulfide isomerase/thioredoxin
MKLGWAGLLAAVTLSACGEGDQTALSGEAPSYQAVSLTGEPVSLASLRGSAVLLNVWATWCAPCRQEIPYLAELQQRELANGLRVIGVSIDTAADRQMVADLAPDMGITYDVWLDPDERIGGILRYGGMPASALLDREGVVHWKHVGVLRETTPGFREALDRVLADH